ncbi:hypothetical protein [Streptomyces sp. NPDC003077]|uniref:hypothetical protein n=1 Tax=Streptomyces sp. NPDC003077 TaxID=3154443 RepID=UPI0033B281C1
MNANLIDPTGIPTYTGNIDELEKKAADLKKDAEAIRDGGADIHSDFQGLRAFYQAPEAEQLFATTKPVADKADAFAGDLEKVASALDGFAAEIRPLVEKLDDLKQQAAAFIAEDVKTDEDWQYDDDKVAKNNDLWQDVTTTADAFWAAERAAANKITALVGGTHWVVDDGTHKPNAYRFSAEDMKRAGAAPWGKPVEEEHHWYEIGHWVKKTVWNGLIVDFIGKGIVQDGIVGTADGLLTLFGGHGGERAKAAWNGLGNVFSGLAQYTIWPFEWLLSRTVGGTNGDNEQKAAFRQVLRGFVAWDQWQENPARAAGGAAFNVVTTFFSGGTATATRTGAGAAAKAAKLADAVGKIGRAIDPVAQGSKLAGAAVKAGKIDQMVSSALQSTKASTALEKLRNAFTVTATTTPSGATHLPDGRALNVHGPVPELPPGKTAVEVSQSTGGVPAHSVKYGDDEFLTPDGRVVDGNGAPRKGSAAMVELSEADRAVLGNAHSPATREHATVSVGHQASVIGDSQHGSSGMRPDSGSVPTGHGDSARMEHRGGGQPQVGNSPSGTVPTHHGGHGGQSHNGSGGSADAHSDGRSTQTAHNPHGGADTSHDHSPDDTGFSDDLPHGPEENGAAGAAVEDQGDHWTPMDPKVVEERIAQLESEGHAPGRHLHPSDDALKRRLGTPMTDQDGNLKIYSPASENVGHVKSENNIDPLTGTTVDGANGRVHRVGGCATRFDSAEDMVRADAFFRDYIARSGRVPTESFPISDILGPGGHERLTGFYRDPLHPDEFLPIDFRGGSIKAIYREVDGEYKLITMYANHAPGRHP